MNSEEVIKINMKRFDQYISNADTKASILLTVCMGILALVIFKSVPDTLIEKNNVLKNIMMILLFVINISIIFSIVQALRVIIPRTPKSNNKSFFYFKDVKGMKKEDFKGIRSDILEDDQINQCIILADICDRKMNNVSLAYYGLGIALIGLTILSIISIIGC